MLLDLNAVYEVHELVQNHATTGKSGEFRALRLMIKLYNGINVCRHGKIPKGEAYVRVRLLDYI